MSIEATAEALVADAAPLQEAPVDAPSADETDLSAIWDKSHEPEAEVAEEPAEAAEPEDAEPVEEPEAAVEAPETIPGYLKEKWAVIPEDARNAILKDRDQLHRKLSDMGRQYSGIAPVRDSLVKAIEEFPALKNMKPEQAADEIYALARANQEFQSNPVETILGLAKKHGLEQQLAQAFSGQAITPDAKTNSDLRKELADLKSQLTRVSDPEYLREQMNAFTTESRVLDDVNNFVGKAEHWDDVADVLPLYIPAIKAKMGEGAAPGAVLEAAYKRAVEDYVSEAPPAPVADATAEPDPEKAKAALKAKSVNVNGQSSGKPREMTEAELLSATYDKANKR